MVILQVKGQVPWQLAESIRLLITLEEPAPNQ